MTQRVNHTSFTLAERAQTKAGYLLFTSSKQNEKVTYALVILTIILVIVTIVLIFKAVLDIRLA